MVGPTSSGTALIAGLFGAEEVARKFEFCAVLLAGGRRDACGDCVVSGRLGGPGGLGRLGRLQGAKGFGVTLDICW
jgi:hypothetical protein